MVIYKILSPILQFLDKHSTLILSVGTAWIILNIIAFLIVTFKELLSRKKSIFSLNNLLSILIAAFLALIFFIYCYKYSQPVIEFLNRHFISIILISLLFLFIDIAAIIAANLSGISFKKNFRLISKKILLIFTSLGLLAMFFISFSSFWINYTTPENFYRFPDHVLIKTDWVKQPLKIYFIDKNRLKSININGSGQRDVFKANDPIKEYHFSPDGRYLLIVTTTQLHLLEIKASELSASRGEASRKGFIPEAVIPASKGGAYTGEIKTRQSNLIDSIEEIKNTDAGLKGVIRGIRWSPDSQKFCFEISKWSKYSGQNSLYIYFIKDGKRLSIIKGSRKISSLRWDKKGENLYYLYPEAKDTSFHSYPFNIKVFRISLKNLRPEIITQIPAEKSSIPIENLGIRDIQLFLEGDNISFNLINRRGSLLSEHGKEIGIDKDDYLYLKSNKWFNKKLFKVPRKPLITNKPSYQPKGGYLTIERIRWLPGGRYIIIEDVRLGILIMDPFRRETGQLPGVTGSAFGWYYDVRPLPDAKF